MPIPTPSLADELTLAHGPAMKNRFMLAPLTNVQSNADGTLGEDEYRWLLLRAQGGFGLTMTCAAHVQLVGQGFAGQLGIWSDAHLPGLERLARGIAAAGSRSAVQLHHAGRRAPAAVTGIQPVAPWPDAESGARELSTGEVEQLIEDFIVAALRAEKAGFDGIELHGAHSYVLAQFLDFDNNHRTDGYGGPFEARRRVIDAVIDGIRTRARPNFQIGVRLSPERFGIPIAEACALAESLMTSGKIDYLDMSLWDVFKKANEHPDDDRSLIDYFTALDRGTTRLGVAGKIMDAATAQACLDRGADFVLIGRGAVLHPDFPKRAIADPAFESVARPVSRAYLADQGLSPVFVDYFAKGWRDFVAD